MRNWGVLLTSYGREPRHRRSIRLSGWDYTQAGAYFVTICTHKGKCLFGRVTEGSVQLSAWGEIAAQCWRDIPIHFAHVGLDEWVIMPNHIHGVLWFESSVGASHTPHGPAPGSLGAVVGSFKSAATKLINQQSDTPDSRVWQRNYYEHIIRSERALDAIRKYICDNPGRWELDRYHPDATGPDPQAVAL